MIVIILHINLFKYLLLSELRIPYLNVGEIGKDEGLLEKSSISF